jgi:plasmid stabilization system protein ParE
MRVKVLDTAKADYLNIRAALLTYGTIPASKFRNTYKKFQTHVKKMPEMYPVCEYDPVFRTAVLIYDYILFYEIDKAANMVIIHHILHGSRNIAEIIKNT